MVGPRINHHDGLCVACRANVHEHCNGSGTLHTGCVIKAVDCQCAEDHPKPERYSRPTDKASQEAHDG